MVQQDRTTLPYLCRRGDVWWWRRRLPLPPRAHSTLSPGVHDCASGRGAVRPMLAVSLRTACRTEARRRGVQLSARFEAVVAARRDGMDGTPELQAAFAREVIGILRDQVAQLTAQQDAANAALARQTELSLALASRLDGPATGPAKAPSPPALAAPAPAVSDPIDDPAFEAALLELADREGWWHDDAHEVLEQFDWMLVGLMTVQAEYVRYCARKGLDPATALPSIARLAEGLEATVKATGAQGARARDAGCREAVPAMAEAGPKAPAPGEATRRRAHIPVSEVFARFFAMRSQGYEIDPAQETPSPSSGVKFTQTMLPNIRSTLRLITGIIGDKPLDAITTAEWQDFIATMSRLPRTHGKSSRERRSCHAIAEDLDREDALALARERARLAALRMPPQEIDAAVARLATPRLATNTCLRHMRDAARVIDYAVHHRLVGENRLRPLVWSAREIARRRAMETAAQRRPWHDEIYRLFRTPVFQGALDEPGDALFWAPLLGELAGLRAEEALQLRVEDFRADGGIAYLCVVARDGSQSTKSEESRRNVPLHDHLIALGLLELVALRRSQRFRTLFPHQTRGMTKGRLSENFSKRFTHYRKQHGVYDPALDFDSFRTGFNQRLLAKQVPLEFRQELMGHERSEVIHKNYGRGPSAIETLKAFVDRIELDVSMIRSPFPSAARTAAGPALRIV